MHWNALAAMLTLVAGIAIGVPEKSSACAYHVAISGGVTVAHAASVPVAMAVHAAVDAGRLAPLPELPPLLALVRASNAMRTFAGLLAPVSGDGTAVAFVLVESHLWGRAVPDAIGTRFHAHVDGPIAGDIVVVTSETVLNALLAGRIDWNAARASGVVVLDGPAGPAAALSRWLGRQFATAATAPRHAGIDMQELPPRATQRGRTPPKETAP